MVEWILYGDDESILATLIRTLFKILEAPEVGFLLVVHAVLDDILALLIRLLIVVVSVKTLALILVDVLYDVVNDMPLTSQFLRFHLCFSAVCIPRPFMIPVRHDTKHQMLFRWLVILHLTLFENLFVLELVDAVHDSVGTPHHEVCF